MNDKTFDVGGYDGTNDNVLDEVRHMDYAVYKNGEPYALFRNAADAEDFLALMDAKLPKAHTCSAECVGGDCK